MIQIKFKDVQKTRRAIVKEGLSLRGFSKEIGVSQSYISQLLQETRFPSPSTAKMISDALGVEMEEIFLVIDVTKDNPERRISDAKCSVR